MLLLLNGEELSVAEMQEILGMGQSRISTHLGKLKQAGLVEDRRSGKNIYYSIPPVPHGPKPQLRELVQLSREDLSEAEADAIGLRVVIAKRQDKVQQYFDQLAGKFSRSYCPGRTWHGLSHLLLHLLPAMNIADLGAGEGTLSQLLAKSARKVIAVDSSAKMVDFASKTARENGFTNLEFRQGDMEDPPIEPGSMDLVLFSQALHHANTPQRALLAAQKLLRPGGTIAILDLLAHQFEEARELYADIWLGFREADLLLMLERANFIQASVSVVTKEAQPPHFQTILAIARKPENC